MNVSVFDRVVQTQCTASIRSIEIPVDSSNPDFMLRGESRSIISVGQPTIVLLSTDDATKKTSVRPEARREFALALKRLLENNEVFFTVLHPGWVMPAFVWKKAHPY